MKNTFHAVVERDGDWFVGWCPEIPGANGQGKSKKECLSNLEEAVRLILNDRLEDALRSLPEDALQETISVG